MIKSCCHVDFSSPTEQHFVAQPLIKYELRSNDGEPLDQSSGLSASLWHPWTRPPALSAHVKSITLLQCLRPKYGDGRSIFRPLGCIRGTFLGLRKEMCGQHSAR